MKYLKQISLISTFLLVSCSDDFISLAPISEANSENFYKTQSDFNNAVLAIYHNLQSKDQYGSNDTRFGGGFYSLMEVRADDVIDGDASAGAGATVFEINQFVDNPLSDKISGAWGSIYKTIFDSNTVIGRIENISLNSTLKNQYIAEARFLRGLSYFNAVRLWGDIPLVTSEITPQEALTLKRNSVSDVYKLIEDDFIFASNNLPNSYSGQEGRATSGAAKAFLGKVYLTEKKWSDAVNTLQPILGSYQLLPNINDVFDITKELNREIIFSVRFKSGTYGEGHSGFGTPVYPVLLTKYTAGDTRLPLLTFMNNSNGNYPSKQFEAGTTSQWGRDFPVLRYSDVLLMYSEALNEVGYQANGDAFTYLNAVRTRANVPTYSSSILTNQVEFRNAIQNERRLEFPCELHRWFDLLRTNTAIQSMNNIGVTIKPYQLLFPIPQTEINVYNNPTQFPQNPGY